MKWYSANKRPLPWRETLEPYAIWISEVMLQQTTSEAVRQFYSKFLERFPTVESLAQAPLEDVYELWAGLGYYSRARNLHKAAQILAHRGFPNNYQELLELPGFGPYTSRAVSSIAFNENVGVVDGNTIRVLSRWHAKKIKWWTTPGRKAVQELADSFVSGNDARSLNPALMELGALICSPTKPKCTLCPLVSSCAANQKDMVDKLPLKKVKPTQELWIWKPEITLSPKGLFLTRAHTTPFLKNHWSLPGKAEIVKVAPKAFAIKHTITKHQIYVVPKMKPFPFLANKFGNDSRRNSTRHVSVNTKCALASLNTNTNTNTNTNANANANSNADADTNSFSDSATQIWVPLNQVKRIAPSSLITKILKNSGLVVALFGLLMGCQIAKKMETSSATDPALDRLQQEQIFGTLKNHNLKLIHTLPIEVQKIAKKDDDSLFVLALSDSMRLARLSGSDPDVKKQEIYEYQIKDSKFSQTSFHSSQIIDFVSHPQESELLYVSDAEERVRNLSLKKWLKKNQQSTQVEANSCAGGFDIFKRNLTSPKIQNLTKRNGLETLPAFTKNFNCWAECMTRETTSWRIVCQSNSQKPVSFQLSGHPKFVSGSQNEDALVWVLAEKPNTLFMARSASFSASAKKSKESAIIELELDGVIRDIGSTAAGELLVTYQDGEDYTLVSFSKGCAKKARAFGLPSKLWTYRSFQDEFILALPQNGKTDIYLLSKPTFGECDKSLYEQAFGL